MKRTLIFTFILYITSQVTLAQTQPRFWDEVQTIKKYDKVYEPIADPILFVGSSSIRKWGHLQQAFGSYGVINRGIGGAVTDDITGYLNDLIFPYHPRQIVIYVGENDIPNEKLTADSILNKTILLYKGIRATLPETPIIYIALKPSPSREKYVSKTIATNKLISDYLSHQKNTIFVDVFNPMLDKDGKLRPELFQSDMLHMKLQGYLIWEKAIKPHLLKPQN